MTRTRLSVASGYGCPPLDVSHGGEVFTTRILEYGGDLERALLTENGFSIPPRVSAARTLPT